jgi:hypothetical protein
MIAVDPADPVAAARYPPTERPTPVALFMIDDIAPHGIL